MVQLQEEKCVNLLSTQELPWAQQGQNFAAEVLWPKHNRKRAGGQRAAAARLES